MRTHTSWFKPVSPTANRHNCVNCPSLRQWIEIQTQFQIASSERKTSGKQQTATTVPFWEFHLSENLAIKNSLGNCLSHDHREDRFLTPETLLNKKPYDLQSHLYP